MKKCTLLLVEDNEQDALLIKEALEELDFLDTYFHVVNGAEAIKFLNKQHPYEKMPQPDLILMDINMPVMDGHEALKEIKATDSIRHIPVIMLTTSSRREDILRSYQEHSSSYIVKPDDIFELETLVGSLKNYWINTVKLPKK